MHAMEVPWRRVERWYRQKKILPKKCNKQLQAFASFREATDRNCYELFIVLIVNGCVCQARWLWICRATVSVCERFDMCSMDCMQDSKYWLTNVNDNFTEKKQYLIKSVVSCKSSRLTIPMKHCTPYTWLNQASVEDVEAHPWLECRGLGCGQASLEISESLTEIYRIWMYMVQVYLSGN